MSARFWRFWLVLREQALALLQECLVGEKEQQEVEGVIGKVENTERAEEQFAGWMLMNTAVPDGCGERVRQRSNDEHDREAHDRARQRLLSSVPRCRLGKGETLGPAGHGAKDEQTVDDDENEERHQRVDEDVNLSKRKKNLEISPLNLPSQSPESLTKCHAGM